MDVARKPKDPEIEFLTERCHKLWAMLKLQRDHPGECLGDHPKWMIAVDRLLLDHELLVGETRRPGDPS